MIHIDSQIKFSDRDRLRKHIDGEKRRKFLAYVNSFIYGYRAASYLRNIVVNLLRRIAVTVALNVEAVFY